MKKKLREYILIILVFIVNIFCLSNVNKLIDLFTKEDLVYKIPVKIRKSTMDKIILFTSNENVIRRCYELRDSIYEFRDNGESLDSLYDAIYNPLIFTYQIGKMDNSDIQKLFNGTINTSKIDVYTIFKYMNSSQTHKIYSEYLGKFDKNSLNNIYVKAVKNEYKNLNVSIFDINKMNIILSSFMIILSFGLLFIINKFDINNMLFLNIISILYIIYLIKKMNIINFLVIIIILTLMYLFKYKSKMLIDKWYLYKMNVIFVIVSIIISIIFNTKIMIIYDMNLFFIIFYLGRLNDGQKNKENIKFRNKKAKE